MRNAKIFIPLVLALVAGACGPVEWLNPCFNEEDVVFDPALVGTWKEPDGESMLKFQKADDNGYALLYTEMQANNADPEQSRYEAHLVRLGDFLFLDLVPKATQAKSGSYAFSPAPSGDESGFQPHLAEVGDGLYASLLPGQQASEASHRGGTYDVHLSQAHWVFRVRLDGDSLRLADLSEDWFKEAVDQGRVDIGFERVDGSLVLTASTKELRAFLLEFAGDEGAFPEDSTLEFQRQK